MVHHDFFVGWRTDRRNRKIANQGKEEVVTVTVPIKISVYRERISMNKEWSELNKTMQMQIKSRNSFRNGIMTLLLLREKLIGQIAEFENTLTKEQMCAIPFIHAEGYHNKTIAYSLYHIFRIEDIVAHTVIAKDEQVFFAGNYKSRMHSPIITTGNELVKQEIADFSKELDLSELYQYVYDVNKATSELLKQVTFDDLKKKYTEQDKETVRTLGVVSEDEKAVWLIDYWCNKDLKGLIQMPFSRHWIMHIEASLRIRNKV